MAQDPALPKFEVPLTDEKGGTSKYWYFFFQGLLQSISSGVTQIIAGTNVTITPAGGTGAVTINATGGGGGSGTVTSVGAGTGLTASPSPIVGAGTLAITNTAVTPGSYTNTNLTVNAQGQITAASNGSGGSVALPGTIADLVTWWASDNILGTNNAAGAVSRLQERTPWIGGVLASKGSLGAIGNTLLTASLNGLNGLKFPTVSPSGYTLQNIFPVPEGFSVFVVINMANVTTTQAVVGSANGGLAMYMVGSAGTAKFALVETGVVVLATGTNAYTPGTAFQCNLTYAPSTGAYVMRQARAANGSGTVTTALGANNVSFLGSDFNPTSSPLNGAIVYEVIVYNRALSPAEVTNLEAYLLAKWGV